MCLIILAYQTDPRYPFILASNRDEFYRRSSDPLGFWENQGNLLAGRDRSRGGVWLGITRTGRFAAVTNIREGQAGKRFPVSRGDLTRGFLVSNLSAEQYIETLQQPLLYGGFHLLLGDQHGLFHYSNRERGFTPLQPGIHGISNHLFNDTWLKTQRGKQAMLELVEAGRVNHPALQQLLAEQPVKAEALDSNLEQSQKNPFLWSKEYGTCASSSLIIERNDQNNVLASMLEKRYYQLGTETGNRRFDFRLGL